MTAADLAAAEAPAADAPVGRRRGLWGWGALVAALVVVGVVGALIAGLGRAPARDGLDPDSPGPEGARALAQLLRDNGVEVTVARDRATATRLASAPDTTLVLPDDPTLSDPALTLVADAGADVVLVAPHARGLRLLFPGARPAGVGDGAVTADCTLPETRRAGAITPGDVFAPGPGDVGCYPTGDGVGLLSRDGGRLVAIDGTAVIANEHLAEDGNAALALALLGRHPRVVWFVPDLADSDLAGARPDLGTLTPPWVTPAIVLLLLAGLAAGLWRGRRFGPLVAERLPVSVRANETAEGRARLYARSRDAAHAAEALRTGALARLRHRLGLAASTPAAQVATMLSARIARPLRAVSETLAGPLPTTDRGLVALSDALADLEAALDAASAPGRTTP